MLVYKILLIINIDNRKTPFSNIFTIIGTMSFCLNYGIEFETKGQCSCSVKCTMEYIKKLEELNGPLLDA